MDHEEGPVVVDPTEVTATIVHLLIIGLATSHAVAPGQSLDATLDSQALTTHVEDEYGDYLQVFVGHLHCDYDFVADEVMNVLADEVIREIADHAAAIIRSHDDPRLRAASDEVVAYAADLAALSLLDARSTERSKVIHAEYADGDRCAASFETNRERYERLRRARGR